MTAYSFNSIRKKPKIYIEVNFGLSNRLRALASAFVLARKTKRELIVIWQPDIHCNCTFDDLFTDHNLNVLDSNPFETGEMIFYDYMNGQLRRANKLKIDHETDKDIYIKSAYTLEYSFYNKNDENEFLQTLKPIEQISKKLEELDLSSMIGLHIRMGAGKNYDKDRWDSDEFLDETGKEFMHFWRERSHYYSFVPIIRERLEKDSEQKFFLSADLEMIYEALTDKFGKNIVFNKRTSFDRSKEQQQSALLDLYCLSKTKIIYGSAWSAFTEIASRIGGNQVKLSGIDFAIKDYEITRKYIQTRSNFDIPIVVVINGFSASYNKILDSLNNVEYFQKVKLIISITNDKNSIIEKSANAFEWKHGDKEIYIHNDLEINEHILFAGNLSRFYDGIILIDEELFISPYFYHYVISSFSYYRIDNTIAGFSLQSMNFNKAAHLPFIPLTDGNDVFFLQVPSDSGQFWSKEQWFAFTSWYNGNKNNIPTIEDGLPPSVLTIEQQNWRTYFYWYMIKNNRYFIFPRFSLACKLEDLDSQAILNELFINTPLLFSRRNFIFQPLSESLSVYDAYYEIIPERLKRLQPILRKYDFACDFYGLKPISQIKNEYLITSKHTEREIYSFARVLKPHEANIITNLSGQDIFLSKSEAVIKTDEKHHLFDQLLHYFNSVHDYQTESYPQLYKEFRLLKIENQSLNNQIEENKTHGVRMESLIQQQKENIYQLNKQVENLTEIIKQKDLHISEKDKLIKQFNDVLIAKEAEIKQFNDVLIAKEAEIKQFNDVLIAKEAEIKQLNNLLLTKEAEVRKILESRDQITKEKDELTKILMERTLDITELNSRISALNNDLTSYKNDILQKEMTIKSIEASLTEYQINTNTLKEKVQEKESKIKELQDLLKSVEASYTFRIGKAILWPLLKLKSIIKK
ncbi:MAG: hypothetical protein WBJ84_06720 [Bacteroidales bacterium]